VGASGNRTALKVRVLEDEGSDARGANSAVATAASFVEEAAADGSLTTLLKDSGVAALSHASVVDKDSMDLMSSILERMALSVHAVVTPIMCFKSWQAFVRESKRQREPPQVVMQVDAASSEDLEAEVQDIKEQVAKDLGVDAATVTVDVTDDGRVAVSAVPIEGVRTTLDKRTLQMWLTSLPAVLSFPSGMALGAHSG